MQEIEKSFKCPFCLETISMMLDVSVEGTQTYIEDCEVCCHPIQITFTVDQGEITFFSRSGAGG
jgi:transcription elongation factor Elf1